MSPSDGELRLISAMIATWSRRSALANPGGLGAARAAAVIASRFRFETGRALPRG